MQAVELSGNLEKAMECLEKLLNESDPNNILSSIKEIKHNEKRCTSSK